MNKECIWYLRCVEAPEIAYTLPSNRKLRTASNRNCVESKASNPECLMYGYETLLSLRQEKWSVTPLKQGHGISINGHTIESGKTTPLTEGDILEFPSGSKLFSEKGKQNCKFQICKRSMYKVVKCHDSEIEEKLVGDNDKENQGHGNQNTKSKVMFSAQTNQWAYRKYLSPSQRGSVGLQQPLCPKGGDSGKLTSSVIHYLLKMKTSLELVVRNCKSQATNYQNPSKWVCSNFELLKPLHKTKDCRVVLKDIGPLLGKRKKISLNLLRQKMKFNDWSRNEKKLLLQSRKANKFSLRVKSL